MGNSETVLGRLLGQVLAAEAADARSGPRDRTADCPALLELVNLADADPPQIGAHPQFSHIRHCSYCQRVMRLQSRLKHVAASEWEEERRGSFRLSQVLELFLATTGGLCYQPVPAYREHVQKVEAGALEGELELPGTDGALHITFERTPDSEQVALVLESVLREADGEFIVARVQVRTARRGRRWGQRGSTWRPLRRGHAMSRLRGTQRPGWRSSGATARSWRRPGDRCALQAAAVCAPSRGTSMRSTPSPLARTGASGYREVATRPSACGPSRPGSACAPSKGTLARSTPSPSARTAGSRCRGVGTRPSACGSCAQPSACVPSKRPMARWSSTSIRRYGLGRRPHSMGREARRLVRADCAEVVVILKFRIADGHELSGLPLGLRQEGAAVVVRGLALLLCRRNRVHCPHCEAVLDDTAMRCAACGNDVAFVLTLPDGQTCGPFSLAQLRQYAACIPDGAATSQGGTLPRSVRGILEETSEPRASPQATAETTQDAAAFRQEKRRTLGVPACTAAGCALCLVLLAVLAVAVAVYYPRYKEGQEAARVGEYFAKYPVTLTLGPYGDSHTYRWTLVQTLRNVDNWEKRRFRPHKEITPTNRNADELFRMLDSHG